MIGYYVHHQGRGHLHRAQCVAAQVAEPVTLLSSLPRPAEWRGPWVPLPPDTAEDPVDHTARGRLHWVPLHHRGHRERMGRTRVRRGRPVQARVLQISGERSRRPAQGDGQPA
ncbi:hypothetical protein ABZ389_38630, partial [Streptomyces sp. NPDC005877]